VSSLESTAVPQADDLDKVRAVIAAIAEGADNSGSVAEHTGFSLRHVEYRMRAARLLGLLDDAGHPTRDAGSLLATPSSSEDERLLWRRAIEGNATLNELAPDLFARQPPTRTQLAERIAECTAMAQSTAMRRASTLLTWRRRLASRQLDLFDGV
jgi:hypothetical protein